MYRYLIEIGSLRIPSYGVMAIIAYFVALWISTREGRRLGLKPYVIQSLTMWIIIGMILGGRIWSVIEHWELYSDNILQIFEIWRGGMVFYGGFIGGFIGGLIFIRMNDLSLTKILDIMSPGVALAIGIGRIGCFLNGCCFGRVTDSPLGICFPKTDFPPAFYTHLKKGLITTSAECSLPVIPTQLISTVNLLVIFGIIWFLRKKETFNGFNFYMFLGLYGIHRFVIDIYRYYEGKALVLEVVTLSQFVSILMILASIIFIAAGFLKKIDKT